MTLKDFSAIFILFLPPFILCDLLRPSSRLLTHWNDYATDQKKRWQFSRFKSGGRSLRRSFARFTNAIIVYCLSDGVGGGSRKPDTACRRRFLFLTSTIHPSIHSSIRPFVHSSAYLSINARLVYASPKLMIHPLTHASQLRDALPTTGSALSCKASRPEEFKRMPSKPPVACVALRFGYVVGWNSFLNSSFFLLYCDCLPTLSAFFYLYCLHDD